MIPWTLSLQSPSCPGPCQPVPFTCATLRQQALALVFSTRTGPGTRWVLSNYCGIYQGINHPPSAGWMLSSVLCKWGIQKVPLVPPGLEACS